ncbi:general transcription factor IIH subunit 5-like [Erinaceus europaeus]|uniref:General transcription and DNA repair factor IIH subunit TFB5 n=1 Tax=Erinaceus europaeus TaxID=9365 RepID=A0ABM3XGE4_ERIEU|nr:general transcription factor IIH subunit 5-like [Erinaceus europaeus]
MVNVLKGVLIECDPAMKQFLLYLAESKTLGKKFIIQDLNDTHVFVIAELVEVLLELVSELMKQNTYLLTQKCEPLWPWTSCVTMFFCSFSAVCMP